VAPFQPFAGLRYARDRVVLDDVIAPPYDVISPEQQAALEARSSYNAVRVELPRDVGARDRYEVARDLLQEWRSTGILVQGTEPALYGQRMTFTDETGRTRQTIGVTGALGLQKPGEGDILPHEQTTPKAKSDRLQLLRATATNLSPIWGLSLAEGLSGLIPVPDRPVRATDSEGVIHEVWPITDPAQVSTISSAIEGAPVVIADGHHRFETALNYQAEKGPGGPQDQVMAFVVELVEDQLSVQAIHRLVSGLPTDFDIPAALDRFFDRSPTDPIDPTIGQRMVAAGGLALVTPDGTWLLRPRRDLASMQLDSQRIEAALADLPPHEVVYQHGWDESAAAVNKGEAQAAVLLRPATIAQIAATGRGGDRMPPKTTFFWPKLRTGLVFRPLN
jgi:uncharacterized protein (DUF1015 family)